MSSVERQEETKGRGADRWQGLGGLDPQEGGGKRAQHTWVERAVPRLILTQIGSPPIDRGRATNN
jgi:hypothetical protein